MHKSMSLKYERVHEQVVAASFLPQLVSLLASSRTQVRFLLYTSL